MAHTLTRHATYIQQGWKGREKEGREGDLEWEGKGGKGRGGKGEMGDWGRG